MEKLTKKKLSIDFGVHENENDQSNFNQNEHNDSYDNEQDEDDFSYDDNNQIMITRKRSKNIKDYHHDYYEEHVFMSNGGNENLNLSTGQKLIVK